MRGIPYSFRCKLGSRIPQDVGVCVHVYMCTRNTVEQTVEDVFEQNTYLANIPINGSHI